MRFPKPQVPGPKSFFNRIDPFPMDNIIELRKISRCFGSGENRVLALRDIDLDIARGDFVAILGQSGSGKSTLMNLLGCLDHPTSGAYRIDGIDASQFDDVRLADLRGRKFGFIFQRYNLLGSLSAAENVALPAVYSGSSRDERLARARELMTGLDMPDKFASRPHQLSGGQQQRVAIGRSLMNGGEIILADEPTGALDSHSGEMVLGILRDLHAQGHTVILVTHDRHIASYAHREIELKDGAVISDRRRLPAASVPPPAPVAGRSRRRLLGYWRNQLVESFRMSVQAIVAHKLRSLLTMLGIIIGIASVVSMVALGQGTQDQVLSNISALGTNTIDIYPGSGFGDLRADRMRRLTVSDSDALAEQSYLAGSSPVANASGVLSHGNVSVNAQLRGVGERFFDVKGVTLDRGRFFDADDVKTGVSVVVIDPNTRDRLFPGGDDPLGRVIIFHRRPLKIVGVTAKQDGGFGDSNRLNLWAPHTTVTRKITGNLHIDSISVRVKDDVISQVAEKDLTELLAGKRGGRRDFHVYNSDSVKQTIQRITVVMTLFVSGIALISLTVGGIGVMNIMLVSVTERTREIGIRMAIGARPSNIRAQFLIEAVLICLVGGAAGVALSFALGAMALYFLQDILGEYLRLSYSTWSFAVALGCSSGVGIVFGFVPARNASKMDPIEALSRE